MGIPSSAGARGSSVVERANATLYAHAIRAYLECDTAIQEVIRDTLEIINDPATDDDDRAMSFDTLREALFPDRSPRDGLLGEDVEQEERSATGDEADAVADLDREEDFFARRVAAVLRERDMTQGDLADRLGIGQPAVSMMLNRKARPQRRTVLRVAESLGVPPESLWPI